MLGLTEEQDQIAFAWEKVDQKTSLPQELSDFFDRVGPVPAQSGCRRAYQRFYIRDRAILHLNDTILGVYTIDASRQGLGFLSPIPIDLKERCRIRLPKTKEFQLQIVRCRQVAEGCYECGAMFILSIPSQQQP